MRSNLLNRYDFDYEEDYINYLERQVDSLDYWDELDHYVSEAINEYRNDKESYINDSE